MAYGLLLRRSATIVERQRLQLAERGEKYLSLCDGGAEIKQIKFYLDNAFNPWIAIAATMLLWAALFMAVINPRAGVLKVRNEEEHEKICNLFTLSAFAANPLFGMIVAIELIAVAAAALLVMGNVALIKRAVAQMLEAQAERSVSQHLHAH